MECLCLESSGCCWYFKRCLGFFFDFYVSRASPSRTKDFFCLKKKKNCVGLYSVDNSRSMGSPNSDSGRVAEYGWMLGSTPVAYTGCALQRQTNSRVLLEESENASVLTRVQEADTGRASVRKKRK